jgi:threonine/homoserine/homoserine lactone efflux protein
MIGFSSPGPNILAVIGTSMAVSRSAGLALGFGVATGSMLWAILTVLGLSALLATFASAIFVIKIFGGLYLLWLAYKAFKSAASKHDIEATQLSGGKRSAVGYYMRGLTVQMTNPKAILSWIAIVSLGFHPDAPLWVGATIVIGAFTLSLLFHSIYAIAFSTPAMVRLYSKARRSIQGVLGTFFAFAGIKLLTSR